MYPNAEIEMEATGMDLNAFVLGRHLDDFLKVIIIRGKKIKILDIF